MPFRRSSATSSICVNWRLYPAFEISGVFARDVVPVDLVEQRELISSAKDYVLPFLMTRCVGAWNCCLDSECNRNYPGTPARRARAAGFQFWGGSDFGSHLSLSVAALALGGNRNDRSSGAGRTGRARPRHGRGASR
jgi:hypothetical protein